MEKVQAREDRKTKLQDELEQAKINAETGEAVFIREGISVKELADKLGVKVKDVIGKLMTRGILATINQPLDAEVAVQLCSQFGFSAEVISYEDEVVLTQEEGPEEDKVPRPPVVTVMGHVDHGKSSLLEAIHDVDITSKEFGGITQHIGAYKVKRGEKEYVFLDTPGHEAFTLMRARGAQVTDIVILVVAADDGVMPQTVEAINHCRAANVPIVVAINKMDKPGANPDRVKQDLMAHGVVAEEFGGEAITCAVSAKARQGIDELLEMVSIVSDMLQLRASPNQPGAGTILESRLDRARGPVASVLIQDGTLKVGDLFLCGSTYGHVRGLFDDRGQRLETVGPATPVEVLGFAEVPAVGALFQVMEDEAKARQVASFRKEQEKAKSLRTTKIRLENVFGAIQQGELKELALIVKADVQGSLEALNGQIQNLPQDQVRTRIVHQGVGAISESDILLASASNALVIGFNVRADKKAVEISKSESVEILTFTVIYDLVEQLRSALSGMLKPIEREVILGHAEVREIFRIGKVGTIAGSIIVDGRVQRSARARILRDNVVVFTGKFASLRHYKDDVSEVKEGSECGIGLENFADIKPGDVIEAFEIQMEERKL
jgi:translation initiation factor IF-2